jgi:hypothetical protein
MSNPLCPICHNEVEVVPNYFGGLKNLHTCSKETTINYNGRVSPHYSSANENTTNIYTFLTIGEYRIVQEPKIVNIPQTIFQRYIPLPRAKVLGTSWENLFTIPKVSNEEAFKILDRLKKIYIFT